MLLLQNVEEFLQTHCEDRIVFIVPLLITDTHEFEVEWCRVSHIGTYLSPLSVRSAISEFYEVEGILDVWVQIFKGNCFLAFIYCILELTS